MRISGMKTGLDVEGLVKQLMEVERKPVEALRKRMSTEESKNSTWSEIKTKLEALKDLSDKLKTQATFSERTVTLSDETIASVTAGATASTGSLDLEVRSLATSHRVESGIFSSTTTPLGYSGTIIIDGKAITITPDDTLEGVQTKIIQQNINATCRVVKLADDQYKLVITSNGTGASSAISYSDSDTATYSVSSSNTGVATASISGNAVAGNYAVSVNSLASAHHVQSDSQLTRDTALGLGGSFTINGATITVSSSDSLDTIANAINSAHAGVVASVFDEGGTYRLRLLSETSGQAGAITFTDPGGVLRGLGVLTGVLGVKNQISAAQDASYSVNGTSYTSSTNTVATIPGVSLTLVGTGSATVTVSASGGVLRSLGIFDSAGNLAHETVPAQDAVFAIDGYVFRRSNNNVTDAITGLTINLKKVGTTTVEIAESSEELLKTVKDWVSKYNDVVDFLKQKTKYDLKAKSSGPLTGDSLARDLLSKLQLKAIYSVPGLTTINSLDDIGITVGKFGSADADKLVIDEDKLKEKLNSNKQDVMKLFGAPTQDVPSPTDGIALGMWNLIDSYTHSQTGLVPRHTNSIDLVIQSLQKQVEDWEIRLARRESELYAKYSKMEVALTRLQNQAGTLNKLIY